MIRGAVDARLEGIVRLRLRGRTGVELDIDVLVDSGCALSLTLPAATVAALGLARRRGGTVALADGSVVPTGIYDAEVEWDGVWRPVLVSEVGDEPLVGMKLMAGHRLQMDVVPGGAVEITRLP